ncbi:hypothetical protein CSHISOI_06878 [Colletotrichum shisoi]|uniref:Secreted protein n=1 Tax=Colletotrichum shisoi TaxID=2078593 RepID=A0A5Q4BPL7_9PEZI|nr:hypothetical protein CSHISOI_06878 [Colletotrichum shisoi]
MKFLSVVASVALLTPAVHGAWCTSYGISTRFACASGRFQFCCDAPNSPAGDYNTFRGDCRRPEGNTRNCGDGGYVSCVSPSSGTNAPLVVMQS